MTIYSIEQRRIFWGNATNQYDGPSIGDAYKKHITIFDGKDVLEIGPGNGRQFLKLKDKAVLYSIADIAPKVLEKSVFITIPKYQITSYCENNFNKLFDVITFWYVIHHVVSTEINDFFLFLNKHLKVGGYIYFNMPGLPEQYGPTHDNGVETSLHSIKFIKEKLLETGFAIKDTELLSKDCFNILAIKLTG